MLFPVTRLDRYLLSRFFLTLLVVTLAIGLTIVVINMVEQLPDFIDHNVPLLKILEYYFYFAGWVLKTFLPMFVMLAVLFTVSMLARKLELLALRASGLSLYRIAAPIVFITLVIAAAHFYYNEFIFPPANKKRVELKEFTIEARSRQAFTVVRGIYRQINPGHFYTIGKFNVGRQEGEDIKIYKTTGNRLDEILIADRIVYQDARWRALDGMIRYFQDTTGRNYTQFDTLTLPYIEDKPDDFARRVGKPEDMSLEELQRYINVMKRTGGPYLREQIDLKIKYAYPLTSFVVTLICIPFAANPRRSGIAVSLAVGAGIALAYFVLFRITQSAGYNEKIPEEVAVWGVNALFFLIGIIAMLKAKK